MRSTKATVGTSAKVEVNQKRFNETYNSIHALPYLREFAMQGSMEAVATIIDLEDAIKKASLTEKQKAALYWFFDRDYSQREAAKIIGGTQQSIQQHIRTAIVKIAEHYQPGEDYSYTEDKASAKEAEEKRREKRRQYYKEYNQKRRKAAVKAAESA